MTKERSRSVSYAKAIAILLMVLAHAQIFKYGQQWINMFHMPLFFMMSGYCFKEVYLSDTRSFLNKRFVGIYWPYVKWGLIFLLLHNLFFDINIYSDSYGYKGTTSELYSLRDFAHKGMAIIFALGDSEQLLGGYWFLRELFVGYIVFYVLVLFTNRRLVGGAFLLVINMVFLVLGSHNNIYGTQTILAALFIWVGYMVRQHNITFYKKDLFPFVGLMLVSVGTIYWQASCLSISIYTYIPFLISAVWGSLAVLSLCEAIDKCNKLSNNTILRFLNFIGNNTLTILTWHFLSFKLVSYCIIQIYGLPVKQLSEFPAIEEYARQGWWLAYFIVGVSLPLCLAHLNKFIKSKWLKL